MQSPICNHQSPQLALGKNRHNPTESDKIRRKLVCARTLIHAHAREELAPSAILHVDSKTKYDTRRNDRCGLGLTFAAA